MVIPARDERDHLPACLTALDRAAAQTAVPVTLVVVLDGCTDDSAEVVARTPLRWLNRLIVLTSSHGNVGYARDLGARTLLAEYSKRQLWLASSDADSTVPVDWFVRQLRHRELGAAAVLGTVQVADWSRHSARTRRRYLRAYRPVDGHRHTHGANLAMTADSYLAVGGFPHLVAHEDIGLARALIAAGQQIAWAADLPVTTSARLLARAPTGFAHHLRLIAARERQLEPGQVTP